MDAHTNPGLDTLTQIQVFAGLQRALDFELAGLNGMDTASVRRIFQLEVGNRAKLDNVQVHNEANKRRTLTLSGVRADGTKFAVRTPPFWGDPIAQTRIIVRQLFPELSAAAKAAPQPLQEPIKPTPKEIRMADNTSQRLSKLASIPGALDKLLLGMEQRAEKFLNRVEGVNSRADTVFSKAGTKLDATANATLDSVDKYLDAIEQATNGAPTGPLPGSTDTAKTG